MPSISEVLQAGVNFHNSGNLEQAERSYRQVLQADPRNANAMHLLGVIAAQVGKYALAIEIISAAIRVDGGQAPFHVHLGEAYRSLGQLDQAVACYRQAVRIKPDDALAHNNLGTLLQARAQLAETQASQQGAMRAATQPDVQRQYSAAAAAYSEALRLKPDYVEALMNHGLMIQSLGQLDAALACFDRAVGLNPSSSAMHLHRADLYRKKCMTREAMVNYQEALRLQPNYPEAHNNCALLLFEAQQTDAAIECCRKGLELAPNTASLHDLLAFGLLAQGRAAEAIVSYRKSVELRPPAGLKSVAHSNLLYALNFVPGLDPSAVFAEHLAWAHAYAEPLTGAAAPHANDRSPERRLRVGYLSPHFRRHAVNFFFEPMLAAHDPKQFEIFCYSTANVPDDVTSRLKGIADHWREVHHEADHRIAQMVRADQIDILVDLTGHISDNRLLIFARKPAPIQVTYLGYQNTTGMMAMDYRLTDERADPPGVTDPFYTERLVRLPRSFFCYRPPDEAPPVAPPPALAAGYVTFGSFNNFAKVSPQAIDAWLQILTRVPQSRLLVLAYRGGYLERHLHALAQQNGVDPTRIELRNKLPAAEYLRLIAQADIALDPFPFNGHTTTCDSIWMSVPVVMLQGNTFASRFGGSVLANVGLESLITRSVEQYVDVAVELAGDLDALARLRSELRKRMADSALLDFTGFTRNVERAYRQMWVTWCDSPHARAD